MIIQSHSSPAHLLLISYTSTIKKDTMMSLYNSAIQPVGPRAFCSGPLSILVKVVFEFFVFLFGRKNRLNFGEDLFFFFEITSFWPEKSFQFTSKLIWPENFGQVLQRYFESGPWKIFRIKMGHGYKKVGNYCCIK